MNAFPLKPYRYGRHGRDATSRGLEFVRPCDIMVGDILQLMDNIHGVEYQGGTVLVIHVARPSGHISVFQPHWRLRMIGDDASVFEVTVDIHQHFVLLERSKS
jgi:hypothetical protein